MKELIMAYQGEMALKGLNKATFEAALAKALRFRVRELGKFQVYKAQSTMYVEPALLPKQLSSVPLEASSSVSSS